MAKHSLPEIDDAVESLRAFNRFYTHRIGVLRERYSGSRFNLTQSRLLWEVAHRHAVTAAELARDLDLDPGYLSRSLRALRSAGLVRAVRSREDARRAPLTLTAAGRRAFKPLEDQARRDMAGLLLPLSPAQRSRLLAAIATVRTLLDAPPPEEAVVLRGLQPGDIGWVASRHGELYAQEFGWTTEFEALVARIGADFIDRLDPTHEAAWIAERAGQRLGCVFLVKAREEASQRIEPGVAQLRLLLVETDARGLGLGKQLVAQCTRFAKDAGYRRIRLWTQSILAAARSIYRSEGYRLVAEAAHRSFGKDLVGETWELDLASPPQSPARVRRSAAA